MITRKQLYHYNRDGVVFPIKVLATEELTSFREAIESIIQNGGEHSRKRVDSLHLFFDWARRLVRHDELLSAVGEILGDDLLVDGTLVFHKPPRDSSYVSWHQDSVYSGWHLTPSVSAWIALTSSHRRNGCMRVIPGSHKQGLLDHVNVRDDPNLLNRRGERVKMAVDESLAVDVTLRPGEMSLHHSTIIHGSNPNTSDEPRIGFIVRFVTSRTTNRDRVLLRVRGNADCAHLRLAEPAVEMDPPKALAAWRRFTDPNFSS